MGPPNETLQRITRLAPLAEVLGLLDALVLPVAPLREAPAAAAGAVLAEDAVAPADVPPAPVALRDGWAVASDLVLDAGPYAPVTLIPPPEWVEAGEPMPAGTDAILPVDAVIVTEAGADAHASATSGEGVIPAGAEAGKGTILRGAGTRLRTTDAAVLAAAGIESVAVRRPRVRLYSVSVPTGSAADLVSPVIASLIERHGGAVGPFGAGTLEDAFLGPDCDAIVTIGGTGTGRSDAAVAMLRRVGRVERHGIGVTPGESTALGAVDGRPVLMLPGRLDAALASFLVIGRAMLARLAGHAGAEAAFPAKLLRKVSSTVGLAQVALVRQTSEGVEPLATEVFPLQALAQADGWILVPPESEGFAAGARVEVKLLT